MKEILEEKLEILEKKFGMDKLKIAFSNKKFVNKLSSVFLLVAISFIIVSSLLAKYGIDLGSKIFSITGQTFLVLFIGLFALKLFFLDKGDKK